MNEIIRRIREQLDGGLYNLNQAEDVEKLLEDWERRVNPHDHNTLVNEVAELTQAVERLQAEVSHRRQQLGAIALLVRS